MDTFWFCNVFLVMQLTSKNNIEVFYFGLKAGMLNLPFFIVWLSASASRRRKELRSRIILDNYRHFACVVFIN
ncbi:hypothetical protein GQ457_11G016370 [Hibiscus cannabinus]